MNGVISSQSQIIVQKYLVLSKNNTFVIAEDNCGAAEERILVGSLIKIQ